MTDWDASYPRGDVAFNSGDDSVRQNQTALEERLTREHYFPDNGAAGGRPGRHKFGVGQTIARDAALTNPSGGNVWFNTTRRCWQVYNGTTSKWIDSGSVIGQIIFAARSMAVALEGWLACNGQAVSRTTHADLYSIIGDTFGAGDGSTTFNVPDMRGQIPIGQYVGGDVDGDYGVMGGTYGEKKHQLVLSEVPSHNHGGSATAGTAPIVLVTKDQNGSGSVVARGGDAGAVTVDTIDLPAHTHPISSEGGDGEHENRQPSVVFGCFIYSGA